MLMAADYPFLDIIGTMALFFVWLLWLWTLIVVLGDVFSRRDISGWSKAAWTIVMVFLPVLGLLTYIIVNGHGMAERRVAAMEARQQAIDERIRSATSAESPATQIADAKDLLDRGAIDEAEFLRIKERALA